MRKKYSKVLFYAWTLNWAILQITFKCAALFSLQTRLTVRQQIKEGNLREKDVTATGIQQDQGTFWDKAFIWYKICSFQDEAAINLRWNAVQKLLEVMGLCFHIQSERLIAEGIIHNYKS